MQPPEKHSLYDRLGGVYSIATVVDDFINRVMSDPRLNANPVVDEAHHRVPPAGFKYLVTEMVCWAAGGPQKYTGKSMAESHKDLKITGKEWEAFMDDVWLTLDKFKVPSEEQAELRAIVNSTRSDIVVASPLDAKVALAFAQAAAWLHQSRAVDQARIQAYVRLQGVSPMNENPPKKRPRGRPRTGRLAPRRSGDHAEEGRHYRRLTTHTSKN
jgi:hemoglobin